MFSLYILLGLVMLVAGSELTIKPINLVAIVGRQAVFSCISQSHQSLRWQRRTIGYSLYSNDISPEGQSRRAVEAIDDDGRSRLDVVMESVRPDDAGEYRCRGGRSGAVVAELVVLGAVPNCTTELLDDLDLTADGHLTVSCSFNWTKNFDPKKPWFDPTGREFLQTHLSAVVDQTPAERRFLVARIRATDDNDDHTKHFDLNLAAHPTETAYVFGWLNVNLDVLMSVRNVRIRTKSPSNCCSSGKENLLQVGDQLICEADGRPDVEYLWEELLEGTKPSSYRHSHLTLSSDTVGKRVFRCTAWNHIRGTSYNASMQITVRVGRATGFDNRTTSVAGGSSPFATSAPYLVIGLSAAVVVAVVVVVVVVVTVACVIRKTPSHRTADTEMDVVSDQFVANHTAAADAAETEQPVPDLRRRSLPLPAVEESNVVPEHPYEHVPEREDNEDNDNSAAMQGHSADHLPQIDDNPGSELVVPDPDLRLQPETDANTALKSFYEPEPLTLDLHSEAETPNTYTSLLLGLDPTSKATSVVDLSCTDAVLRACSADSCSGQNLNNAVQTVQ